MNDSGGHAGALVRPATLGLSRSGRPAEEVRAVWTPLWRSRALVWLAGCVAFLVMGNAAGPARAFDATRLSSSFGQLGNVLAAPAVRWDAIWYLQIAHDGYGSAREAAFYPLYPTLVRVGSWLTGSLVIAGLLLSFGAMFAALVIVRRLTELELGDGAARATVNLIAFGPMALFLSALYTESLFLALSAGTFYAARRGRWALAGVLGGLAAMTRVTGVLLLVPMLLMFFYGPRGDAAPALETSGWRPRYRLSPTVLWLAVIPAGLGVFSVYLAIRGYGPLAMAHAQQKFSSHYFVGPLKGVWDGMLTAWRELEHEFSGVGPNAYSSDALLQFASLLVALAALVGAARRLPAAYSAYAALGLLIALSSPTSGDPLRDLARYASVLFPLYMSAGAWAVEHRAVRPLLAGSAVLLVFFSAQFATWRWVGTSSL